MAVPQLLKRATRRLERAAERIERAQAALDGTGAEREWLEALTDYVKALTEVHAFTNESIHEKLHELASQGRVAIPPATRRAARPL